MSAVAPLLLDELTAVFAISGHGSERVGWHHRYAERKRCGGRAAGIHPGIDDTIAEFVSDTHGIVLYQRTGGEDSPAGRRLANERR